MPLHWNNRRRNSSRWAARRSPSVLTFVALCAFATLTSCTLDESTSSQHEASSGTKKRRSSSRDAAADDDARDGGPATRISTREGERDASAPEPPKKKKTTKADAGSKPQEPDKGEKSAPDAGNSQDASQGADSQTKMQPQDNGNEECTRMRLKEKADDYLKTMASGDAMSLLVHSSFRYTENGHEERLGAGLWLRRAEAKFARHVLDETVCSSFTQAVMEGVTGRFSFGVRLRYSDGLLLEAEAQFAPELLADSDLDAIIPMGEDTFAAEVPADERMSREELFDFAHSYFDSVTGASSVPPSAPDCRRLQNGAPLGNGLCTESPGTQRFEQLRLDLADEPDGIVTATVLYNGHIGFYLMKISDKLLQNIQIIGGASSQATGW